MHAGLLTVNHEKMSKSLGNFITIEALLDRYHPEVVRFFMCSSHYRSPVNYSEANLDQAHRALCSLYRALVGLPQENEAGTELAIQAFSTAMDDDFNTPIAFGVLFDMAKSINRLREAGNLTAAAQSAAGLRRLAGVFGLLQTDPSLFLQGDTADLDPVEIERLIADRISARHAKDWKTADDLRQALLDQGVMIEDSEKGTTWRRVKP